MKLVPFLAVPSLIVALILAFAVGPKIGVVPGLVLFFVVLLGPSLAGLFLWTPMKKLGIAKGTVTYSEGSDAELPPVYQGNCLPAPMA